MSARTETQATHRTSYAYDANGNQLREQKEILKPAGMGEAILELSPTLDMIRLYEYNGFDQLVSAYTKGQQVTYTYNPNGLRQSKEVGGKRTTHIWDGQNMVTELGPEGTAMANYIRGVGLLQNKGSGTVNYLFNGRGDVVQLTDTGGNVVRSYDYDAFGNLRTVEGNPMAADTNPFRYCAEYLDEESDHIYLRARYYDPRTGRFSQEDPIRDKLNWYTYCINNPIMFIDPFGLYSKTSSAYSSGGTTVTSGTYYHHDDGSGLAGWSENGSTNIQWFDKAINIVNHGNRIYIYARVSILNASDQSAEWNEKYAKLALDGIQQGWSGQYGSKRVQVEYLRNTSTGNRVTIQLAQDPLNRQGSYMLGTSAYENWDTRSTFKIFLYNNNPNFTGHTESQFSATAAHEFGHALGLDDAYNKTPNGYWDSWSKTESIMNNQFIYNNAKKGDYERMLLAHQTNKWQTWP